MDYFDIHTHTVPARPGQALVSIRFPEPFELVAGAWYSVGIHPWDVEQADEADWALLEELLKHPQVLAVGECGLDRCVHADRWEAQLRLFERQAHLAEELGKPLIIHNVRATDVFISLRKNHHYTCPWVLHGFRGKPEAALQAVSQGFYLSLGTQFNEETLRAVPLNRIVLETDESGADIRDIYLRAAQVKGLPVTEFSREIGLNILHLMGL